MTIEIQDLAIVYNTLSSGQVVALDDLQFEVDDGEFVAIVGPSGCGKSTILKTLCGLIAPTRGAVAIGGAPVRGSRADVGVVFQEARLLPWLNVIDNVLIPVRVQGRKDRDYVERARRLLSTSGLKDFSENYPGELSGGMQQRVAICRALAHDPSTLLMDEPFGALDALTREVMCFELLRLWEESQKTVLFVTHSIPEAVLLADRVVVMTARPGRIHAIVDIDLERPRRLETMATPAFSALTGRIREMLNASGDFH